MDALPPLAAFQALCITTAAAVALDARKETGIWRYLFGAVALGLAAVGVTAKPIGDAWPASLALMQELGGSPIPWFVLAAGVYFALRPRWKKPSPLRAKEGIDDAVIPVGVVPAGEAEFTASQYAHLDEAISRMGDRLVALERIKSEIENRIEALSEATKTPLLDGEQVDAVVTSVAGRRVALLENLLTSLRGAQATHANDFVPQGVGVMDGIHRTLGQVVQTLTAHGIEQAALAARFDAIEQEVKGSAEYLVRNDSEREQFSMHGRNPDDMKRQWHSRKKRIEFLERFVSDMLKKEQSVASATNTKVRLDGRVR